MHMGLRYFKGQALVKGITEQETVNWTGIDPGHTDLTTPPRRTAEIH